MMEFIEDRGGQRILEEQKFHKLELKSSNWQF